MRNKGGKGQGNGGGRAGGEMRALEGGRWRAVALSSGGHCETGLSVASL